MFKQVFGSARFLRELSLGVALCTAACGAEPGEWQGDDETGAVSSPILNGTVLSETNSGVVALENFCSGTLLKNQWVLTAAHCVDLQGDRDYTVAQTYEGQFAASRNLVEIEAAGVDSSGRLVLAGRLRGGSTGERFYLTRYTKSGSLDTAFGSSGEVITDFASSTAEGIQDLAFQADGRIVVAGWATLSGSRQIALARYNTSGSLDTSYQADGKVLTSIPSSLAEQAEALVIDSSGRAVIAGVANVNGANFLVARYTTSGVPDTSFGGSGVVVSDFASQWGEGAKDLAIDGNGKLVAAGWAFIDTVDSAAIARYNTNGTLDTTFDGDGKVLIDDATDQIALQAVVVQSSNKVVVGGSRAGTAAVYRVNTNGSLDTTFGVGGRADVKFFGEHSASVQAMMLASDGRIRLGVDVDNDWHVFSYAALTANGGTTPDRVFQEASGFSMARLVGGPCFTRAIAADGNRIFLAGTQDTLDTDSHAAFAVVQPDRTSDTTFGGAITVDMDQDSKVPVDRVYYSSSGDDVAILHLSQGITMNGSRTGYQFPGFITSTSSLPGTNVTCRGYGAIGVDSAGTPNEWGGLRKGTSRVVSVDSLSVILGYVPGATTPQLALNGDSGSTCTTSGGLFIGVHSRGNGTTSWNIKATRFASWANTLIQDP